MESPTNSLLGKDHLFREFKENCPNNNKPQWILINVALIEDHFSAAKALWLIIRFSLSEIPSLGCDSSFTLLSIAYSPLN